VQNLPDDVQKKCEKLSAAVKGYLTRRLFKTEKVQAIIKTIWVNPTITVFLNNCFIFVLFCFISLVHLYFRLNYSDLFSDAQPTVLLNTYAILQWHSGKALNLRSLGRSFNSYQGKAA